MKYEATLGDSTPMDVSAPSFGVAVAFVEQQMVESGEERYTLRDRTRIRKGAVVGFEIKYYDAPTPDLRMDLG